MDDTNETTPSPFLETIRSAVSELESGPDPPYSVELMEAVAIILASSGGYNADVVETADAAFLVRLTRNALYAGLMLGRSQRDEAELATLIKTE